MPEAFHSSDARSNRRRSETPSQPLSRWSVHGKRTLVFIALSLVLHLAAGVGLKVLGGAGKPPPVVTLPDDERLAEQSVEFEIFDPVDAPEAPDAPAPLIEEEPEPEAPMPAAEEPPPPTLSPQNIVELPEAPEETPDDPSYLAERDMRAEEQTIARSVGEATNQEEGGVSEEPLTAEEAAADADATEDAPEEAVAEAEAPPEPPADESLPAESAEAMPAVDPVEESDIALSDRGEVPVEADSLAGQDEVAEAPTEEAAPEVADSDPTPRSGVGRRSLMPSRDQLARAVEPAQRNLIEEQRGDITLLNAQSSEMAAYIIERAKRIYSFLNINAPMTTIYYDDVADLRFPVTIEARIQKDGTVVSVQTIRSSGSTKIDRLVSDATRSGLHGRPLPPAEAFGDDGAPMRFRFALHSDHIEAGTP